MEALPIGTGGHSHLWNCLAGSALHLHRGATIRDIEAYTMPSCCSAHWIMSRSACSLSLVSFSGSGLCRPARSRRALPAATSMRDAHAMRIIARSPSYLAGLNMSLKASLLAVYDAAARRLLVRRSCWVGTFWPHRSSCCLRVWASASAVSELACSSVNWAWVARCQMADTGALGIRSGRSPVWRG